MRDRHSTEDDRRMGPAEPEEELQGGPMESKLPEAENSEVDQIQPEVMMDVDVVDHKPESDFKELFALMRREEKSEIAEAN